jgi:histone deacetylase complex regulatory component SIN3
MIKKNRYGDLLKCLRLYSQGALTRAELIGPVTLLGHFLTLLRHFRHFLTLFGHFGALGGIFDAYDTFCAD